MSDAKDKWFLVYAPEVIIMELAVANPIDGVSLMNWGVNRFVSLYDFVEKSQPGDVIATNNITVIRIGKVYE